MGIKGDFSPGEEDTMISIGYYAGKEYPSPFCALAVKSVAEAQIWLKNHLAWLEEASFGFSIWETNSWDRGPGKRAGKPRVYLSWQRDGRECYGRLFNPETGWRFAVGEDKRIREDFAERAGG